MIAHSDTKHATETAFITQSDLRFGEKSMAEIKVDITNNGIFGYECPICGNEEIELGQNFCQICGEPIDWKEDYE